jgi:hypothetical protein
MRKQRCPGCHKQSLETFAKKRPSPASLWEVHEIGLCGKCHWYGWRHIDYNHRETSGWNRGDDNRCGCRT